jgi:hypothetical protein
VHLTFINEIGNIKVRKKQYEGCDSQGFEKEAIEKLRSAKG